jgi:hypothetical protein
MKSMAATETKEVKSKLQRALEMQAKVASLKEEAKVEALEAVNQAVKDLGELGFAYRLITEDEYQAIASRPTMAATSAQKAARAAKPTAPKVAPGPSANYEAEKTCKVCGGLAGHDARAHRTRKAAFTPAELTELGYQAPSA